MPVPLRILECYTIYFRNTLEVIQVDPARTVPSIASAASQTATSSGSPKAVDSICKQRIFGLPTDDGNNHYNSVEI